jgi:dolichyl-phosphate beta-glucosyltransferase
VPAPYYTIIIPVYNEADRLPISLEQLAGYVQSLSQPWELLFVDDGSSDATVKLLEAQQSSLPLQIVRLPHNQGKGGAVKAGMLAAQGQLRAFLDADLATPPQELTKLFTALEQGADVAIGSRIQADGTDLRLVGRKRQPLIRQLLGKLFRLVATRPFLGTIRDSQCGAKAFTATAATKLFSQQTILGWTFDIEILYLAKRSGMKVAEIPVYWEAQANSKLRPSVWLAISTMRELASLWWIHRRR